MYIKVIIDHENVLKNVTVWIMNKCYYIIEYLKLECSLLK